MICFWIFFSAMVPLDIAGVSTAEDRKEREPGHRPVHHRQTVTNQVKKEKQTDFSFSAPHERLKHIFVLSGNWTSVSRCIMSWLSKAFQLKIDLWPPLIPQLNDKSNRQHVYVRVCLTLRVVRGRGQRVTALECLEKQVISLWDGGKLRVKNSRAQE